MRKLCPRCNCPVYVKHDLDGKPYGAACGKCGTWWDMGELEAKQPKAQV